MIAVTSLLHCFRAGGQHLQGGSWGEGAAEAAGTPQLEVQCQSEWVAEGSDVWLRIKYLP